MPKSGASAFAFFFAGVILAGGLPGGLKYPSAPLSGQKDILHGVEITDPYRWLEDVDSAPARQWIAAQNHVSRPYLGALPDRAAIGRRLAEIVRFPVQGLPVQRGPNWFFTRRDPGVNQPVLYVASSLDAPPRALLDPNPLSLDSTTSLATFVPSRDGKLLAYGLSTGGSDWHDVRIRDVATGRDLGEVLQWIKFSPLAWTPDHAGFYYTRYPAPAGGKLTAANSNAKVYYHRAGTAQSEDKLVYERPDRPEWGFAPEVTEDGRHLVVTVFHGTRRENLIFYRDLAGSGRFAELLPTFEAGYEYLGSRGGRFYFLTTMAAPRGRLIAIDPSRPARENWAEIVPQTQETLSQAVLSGDALLVNYMKDASSRLKVLDLSGALPRDVALPDVSTARWWIGAPGAEQRYYLTTSYAQPPGVYEFEPKSGASRPVISPKLPFDPAHYETRQVFYASKDRTRIPMFLSSRKGLARNGAYPTLLAGYGGFNVALTPVFQPFELAWMERGGLLAIPNLRGGGEYGTAWHDAGRLDKKQNVFDDFIAAAEWLIANRYTDPKRLGIMGASNGGLLVGVVLNQRTELFGAAVPRVGVMDMLRFHKFTVGKFWASDYGSPEDPKDFARLRAYSPLHNIRNGAQYPPTLILTADHDDRVVPAHSFKYAARLQAAQEGQAPILIRIETNAGHTAGRALAAEVEENADILAFLSAALK